MSIPGYLMRKNNRLMFILFSDTGEIQEARLLDESLRKYLPLACQNPKNSIKNWWKSRAVPKSQGGIKEFLELNGFRDPEHYLFKNLGLSLTDCYWVLPMQLEEILTWENVNLFQNFFDENKFISDNNEKKNSYSPNGSLQGQIEKTWIIQNGERCLIKGNRTNYSVESINEVIASELHKLQGYDNFTEYKLYPITNRPYDYGCISKLYTSEDIEFVSAYDILSLTKKRNDISSYEHFIANCKLLGMNTEKLRIDLEYQIMTDFILSQYDRHLTNLGILRDSETLEPLRMAPIFDSGSCLFANRDLPWKEKDIKKIKINSFFEKERSLVKVVQDISVVDLEKLPSLSYIEDMYKMDSKYPKENIPVILSVYRKKIEMYKMLKNGVDPFY